MSQAIFTSQNTSMQRVLPCFPGYAMGGLILTSELEIPYLKEEKANLEEEIVKVENQKKKVKEQSQETQINPQKEISLLNSQIKQLQSLLKKSEAKLKVFKDEREDTSAFETMLPLDINRTVLDYRRRSDESENMHFIVFKTQSMKQQIDNFANHLTQMRYLPAVMELVDQVSKTILNQPMQENQEICLLGSFITLSHVRVMDPIVLRKDAVLSPQIKDKHAKYSVISETVLGGAFIGFGNLMGQVKFDEGKEKLESQEGKAKEKLESQGAKPLASRLQVFSFVSQGAIPDTNQFNLWQTYNSWKKKLTTNPHCGFPIAFRVRSLTDVLKENGVINA